MSKKITILLGTAREENSSNRVASFIKNNLSQRDDLEVSFVDVKDHLFGHTIVGEDKAISSWREIISNTDALLVVSPEYNHSFPGELKILLDSLYSEYKGKVAAIAGVSMGPVAGARVIEQLKVVLHTMNFNITQRVVGVGKVQEILDENGVPTSDQNKISLEKQLNGVMDEVLEKLRIDSDKLYTQDEILKEFS